jgi:hypothetical protein
MLWVGWECSKGMKDSENARRWWTPTVVTWNMNWIRYRADSKVNRIGGCSKILPRRICVRFASSLDRWWRQINSGKGDEVVNHSTSVSIMQSITQEMPIQAETICFDWNASRYNTRNQNELSQIKYYYFSATRVIDESLIPTASSGQEMNDCAYRIYIDSNIV